MEASREISRTPRRLPLCSELSVLQKMRMSHFWDTHHIPANRWFWRSFWTKATITELQGSFQIICSSRNTQKQTCS